MTKIKVNYLAGKYTLTREVVSVITGVGGNSKEEEITLNLTSAQAKVLMKDSLYDKLGFKSIHLVEE